MSDSATQSIAEATYNLVRYDFQVMLINPDGVTFLIRNATIKELSITDTLNQYFAKGYLTLKNTADFLERSVDTDISNTTGAQYIFRGDSRDMLRISITPKVTPNVTETTSEATAIMNSLIYDFVIYNIEDITGSAANEKYKKLYFWDMYHQILLEKHVDFSTAKMPTNTYKTGSTPGMVSTGAAIKGLLEAALPASEGFKLAFADFDAGGTDIFFSAPANWSADECLTYLMDKHVSSKKNNYDHCLLHINRYPKAWHLISFADIFTGVYDSTTNTIGPQFLDRMLIGGVRDSDTGGLSLQVLRTPPDTLYLRDTSNIDTYSFTAPAGYLTQNLINTRVTHSYNFKTKTFNVDVGSNSFENTQKLYHRNYVAGMLGDGGRPSSNLIGNISRKTNKNLHNVFSTSYHSKEQRFGVARNNVMLNSVLLNNSLHFTTQGATYRQSGKFFAVERTDGNADSKLNDKMLGIYLIASVTHTFTDTEYTNDVVAVKTYNFRDLKQTENIL